MYNMRTNIAYNNTFPSIVEKMTWPYALHNHKRKTMKTELIKTRSHKISTCLCCYIAEIIHILWPWIINDNIIHYLNKNKTFSNTCHKINTSLYIWSTVYSFKFLFRFHGHCPLHHHLIQALESAKLLPLLSADRVLKQYIFSCYRSIKSY